MTWPCNIWRGLVTLWRDSVTWLRDLVTLWRDLVPLWHDLVTVWHGLVTLWHCLVTLWRDLVTWHGPVLQYHKQTTKSNVWSKRFKTCTQSTQIKTTTIPLLLRHVHHRNFTTSLSTDITINAQIKVDKLIPMALNRNRRSRKTTSWRTWKD